MNIIAPSILSADFLRLGDQINQVDTAGAQYIHFDVMDGTFVPNISFGFPVLKAVRKCTPKVLDVHLMIAHPEKYIEETAASGADIITVHYETCPHLHSTLQAIRKTGKKACVAVNPLTPVCLLKDVLEYVDMIVIMTVNPGFGGQAFIPASLEKIATLRSMIEEQHRKIDIEVDGGITLDNVEEVAKAGANVFVAGSSVFKGDPGKNTAAFLQKLIGN